MNSVIKWALAGIVTLIVPVVLWNVLFLDYIDQHGKLIPWLLAPVWALISAAIIVGLSDAKKKLRGADQGREGREINPFWGWFACALVIEVAIVALSNT